jgi:hypothetical protein
MLKNLLNWYYQKVADYFFYKWIETKNMEYLTLYEDWTDKKL